MYCDKYERGDRITQRETASGPAGRANNRAAVWAAEAASRAPTAPSPQPGALTVDTSLAATAVLLQLQEKSIYMYCYAYMPYI